MALKFRRSILEQEFWPSLRPHVYVRTWSSKISGRVGGIRFNIRNPTPEMFRFKMYCVVHGASRPLIYPVRKVNGDKGVPYLAVCCPQVTDLHCAQTQQATEEYDLIRFDLQAYGHGLTIERDKLKVCMVCEKSLANHEKPFPLHYLNLVVDCLGRQWKLR